MREHGIAPGAGVVKVGAKDDKGSSQVIAEQLASAGFVGENWYGSFIRKAEKQIRASERGNVSSPDFGKPDIVVSPADTKAVAFEMAMSRASGIENPRLRMFMEEIVRERFGVDRKGTLHRGVIKSDSPREGLVGGNSMSEEQMASIAARYRERAPAKIAAEGVGDESIKRDIEAYREAEASGDVDAVRALERKINQKVDANLVLSGDYDPKDKTAQSRVDYVEDPFTSEERGRKGSRGEQDKGPRTYGSDTEGRADRDAQQVGRESLDVIAADPALVKRFLQRFPDQDVAAANRAIERAKKDPSVDAAAMKSGGLLERINKAISIEAQAKKRAAQSASDSRRRTRRVISESQATPDAIVSAREQSAVRSRGVRSAMSLIDSIVSGQRSYDARSRGRQAMMADRATITNAFASFAPDNPNLKDRIGAMTQRVLGAAAAGNMNPLMQFREAFRQLLPQRARPTDEQRIHAGQGIMSQLEASLTGQGTRTRGGPSTRRMERVSGGKRLSTGRNVLTGKVMRKGVPAARAPLGENTGVKGAGVKAKPYVNDPKAKGPGKLMRKDWKTGKEAIASLPPRRDRVSDAVDEFMADSFSMAVGKGDYSGDEGRAERMRRTARVAMSRIGNAMGARKAARRAEKRAQVPQEISDVRQLASVTEEIKKIRESIRSGRARLDDVYGHEQGRTSRILGDDRTGLVRDEADYAFIRGKPRVPSSNSSREGVITLRDRYRALVARKKVLEEGKSDVAEAIERRSAQGKPTPKKVTAAALREEFRRGNLPRETAISNLRLRLDEKNLDPKERASIEKALSRIRGVTERRKTKKPKPGTPTLSETVKPTVTPADRDEREVTGGEVVGDVVQERGRPLSEVRKRVRKNRKMRYTEKRKTGRKADVEAIASIEGIPK